MWALKALRASVALLVVSCSASKPPDETTSDASSQVMSDTPAASRSVAAISARVSPGAAAATAFESDGRWLVPRLAPELPSRGLAGVRLPSSLDRPFRVRDHQSELEVSVTLLGARAVPAETSAGWVVYRDAHAEGDALHRLSASGTEDFVTFRSRPEVEEVRYSIELGAAVAGLRLVERTLEFLDAGGAPRLRMAPPYVVSDDGTRHDATVTLASCAFDSDPHGPWGRPVVPPGAQPCEVVVSWQGSGATYPLILDPSWVVTGSMAEKRNLPMVAKLASGKVLVAGGQGCASFICSSAELYDPASGTFGSTASMGTTRYNAGITTLPSGKVLVAGGYTCCTSAVSSAEVYDPAGSGTWTPVSNNLAVGRQNMTSTLLNTGKVLVAGGNYTSSADLYDPVANSFTPTGTPMTSVRTEHGAQKLLDGRVLLAGGIGTCCSSYLKTAEIYDPAGAGSFAATGSMASDRMDFSLTLLADGRVLAAGGRRNAGNEATAELFSGSTWGPTGGMSVEHVFHSAVRLGSGKVLIVGGSATDKTTDLYDPLGGYFVVTSPLNQPRQNTTAVLLDTGGVLVAGGAGTTCWPGSCTDSLSNAEVYDVHGLGVACTVGDDCVSGYCVDSVCCDTTCTGNCQACSAAKKGAGADGTCGFVSAGGDPDNDCPDQGAPTCGTDGSCDGAGVCRKYANATVCIGASCSGGTTTISRCSSGVCSPTATPCAPYVCADGTSCASSCSSDLGCVASSYCATGGICLPDQAPGAACASGAQCVSGNCVDGVCCDTPCSALCQACTTALKGSGSNGTCGLIAVGTDPQGECPNDGTSSCQRDGACSGGACRLYAGGTACGTTSCSAGVQTGYACNGAGVCLASTSTACSPYVCATSSACASSCNFDADCIVADYCRLSDHTCQPDQANGAACASGAQCATGNCVDGFCCNGACSGACQACSNAKTGLGNGSCGAVTTGTDPDNECPDDGQNSCSRNGVCGPAGCQNYGAGVSCNTTTCSGGSVTAYACDGLGACKPGTTSSCSPYLCQNAVSCFANCSTDADCVGAAYCAGGTCLPDQAQGAGCGSNSQCVSGNCVDGFCCNALCNGSCQACSAAKKGAGANGACGNVIVGSDPDNECATAAPATCGTNGVCDGSGNCQNYVLGTSCGASTCSGTTQTGQQCNGGGLCVSGSSVQCAVGYVCANASVCATTCTTDVQCTAAYFCRTTDGTCQPDQANGGACGTASQCSSGNCVDGVCCDAPCGGTCQTCLAAKKASGANGTCGAVKVATDPDSECAASASTTCGADGNCDGIGACRFWASGTVCGSTTCSAAVQTGNQCNGSGACATGASSPCALGYTCLSASVCAASCTTDAQCTAAYWCRTTDGTCQPDQANGGVCGAASQCASGNCVDGVCCDAPCGGTCQACASAKTGGVNGTCAPVTTNTDPDSECTAAPQSSCQDNGSCDGVGACKKWPFGTTCGASTCANAVQTGLVCDGTGTCVAGSSLSCATGYACAATGGACATACADDSQCVTSYWCQLSDGTCQPDKPTDVSCTSTTQCVSGNCVDGVCCDSPCTGACQACSAAKKGQGADGSCGAIKASSDPDNECTTTSASGCGTTGSCDGAGACQLYANGTSCGSTTCSAGTQTGIACDGFGTCKPASTSSCAPYVCADASVCATACTVDADCLASAFCDGATGTCKGDQLNGAACATASQCGSGHCVDGVCCAQACGGLCQACSAALKGSGVDGVCDSVQAGSDPQSECGDDGPGSCDRDGYCNGFGACELYASGTACGATTCAGGTQTGYTCNGGGTCSGSAISQCAPYVCQGTVCGASCVGDADCIATSYCRITDGTCQPDQSKGAACGTDSQCTSGHCVDGVCCDGPCGGACQACTASKSIGVDGVCASVVKDTDPDDDCIDESATSCGKNGLCNGAGACALYPSNVACGVTTCTPDSNGGSQAGQICDGLGACQTGQTSACTPYTCKGSACGISCASDADCIPAAYCASDSTCRPDQNNGGACAAASQCISGNCADGVCCDQACQGTCQACSAVKKGAGTDGSCGPVAAGLDLDNECSQEGPNTCGQDGACDGAGACEKYQPGTSCGATQCTGGLNSTLVGPQCSGFGACSPGASTPCDPYTCTGSTSCKTACVTDTDCIAGYRCSSANQCVQKQASGNCATGGECQSGFCVEGVCCNTACDGKCQACTQVNKQDGSAEGLCGNAKLGADPHNDCTASPVTDCDSDGTCDGNGQCALYAPGTACGATNCNGNVQTGYACDGTGTCNPNATTDCGLYACSGSACNTTCAADGDCTAAGFCETVSGECRSRSKNGDTCTSPSTCQTGYCVDGVCCDDVCSGQCQACDIGGATGKCSPVLGLPHGARAACAGASGSGPDQKCQARTCDGTRDVTQCVGYVGSEIACRDQACDPSTGSESFSAACDGEGFCGTADAGVTVRKCAPFVCGADACLDLCAKDADCQAGNRCETSSGQCVSSTTCDGDHTLTAADSTQTDCSPFKCDASGTCINRCSSTDDCIAAHVCNSDSVCVTPTTATPQTDSGCGCRTAGVDATGREAWLLFAAALSCLSLARRRSARRFGTAD